MSTKLKAMPVPTVDLTDFIQDLLRKWIFPNNSTRLFTATLGNIGDIGGAEGSGGR